jgi:hypothetical protein
MPSVLGKVIGCTTLASTLWETIVEEFMSSFGGITAARAANLARAHQVRSDRARVKRALAAGTMTIAAALEEPSCQTMRVLDLLGCQPRWGRVRALRTLQRLQMSELRLVGELTHRQQTLIVDAVSGKSAT